MAKRHAPSASDIRHFAAGIGAALAVWLVPFSAWPWVIGAGVVVYGVLRMRFLRELTRVSILWTLLCAVPVYLLIVNFKVDATCGEICAIQSGMADMFISVIFLVWLPVTLAILWFRDRQPRPSN
jgi:hypothetical protein